MKVVLVARASDGSQEYAFDVGALRVNVGRKDTNHVHFDDPHCSSLHCRFWVEGGKLWVEDLGSKNGTLINGTKVIKDNIYVDDRVTVGNFLISICPELNPQDVMIRFLNPSGTRTSKQKIDLTTPDGLGLIRHNPHTAVKNPTAIKRLAHEGARHVPPPLPNLPDTRWQQGWRHWLASLIDMLGLVVIFCLPFAIMLWWTPAAAPGDVRDLVKTGRLAGASVASMVLGWFFWAFNTRSTGGSIGQRITGLASVPHEDRRR